MIEIALGIAKNVGYLTHNDKGKNLKKKTVKRNCKFTL